MFIINSHPLSDNKQPTGIVKARLVFVHGQAACPNHPLQITMRIATTRRRAVLVEGMMV